MPPVSSRSLVGYATVFAAVALHQIPARVWRFPRGHYSRDARPPSPSLNLINTITSVSGMAVCIGRLTNADFSCPYSVFTSRGVHSANGCGVDDPDLLADSPGAETERPAESSPGSCGGGPDWWPRS